MKRLIFTLLVVFFSSLSLKALNYEDARREAWFLTDKMAYELNLTSEQCDLAYQINLEYLMSIRHSSDCRGIYWTFRNDDFRCVLFPWQYSLYMSLDYFYYPIRWVRHAWYYPVWRHYRRGYYYFDRPVVYVNYRGGSWRHRNRRSYSPYRGRHFSNDVGLRDRYHGNRGHRPDAGRPSHQNRPGRDFDNNRLEHQRPSHGNVGIRPERKPDLDKRPSRGERPSGIGNSMERNPGTPNNRPSREFGRDNNRGGATHNTRTEQNRTEHKSRGERNVSRERNSSHDRGASYDRGGSHERGGEGRHFGR